MPTWLIVLLVIVAILLLIVFWFIATYNTFVRMRNRVEESWRQVDVELHRRFDLIPNLVETVKGYASHERGVLEAVTQARAAISGSQTRDQRVASENMLTEAIGRLFAVAEAYPDLKANQNFQALQAELSGTEDRIASARRYYNANVREYHTKLETFPASIVGNMTGFRRTSYFEAQGEVRDVPRVDFGQGGGSQAVPQQPFNPGTIGAGGSGFQQPPIDPANPYPQQGGQSGGGQGQYPSY